MSDFFSRFEGGELIGLVAVVGAFLAGVIGIIGHFWRENRLIALKQDLLNRGLSPHEIQTVINAGTGFEHREAMKRHCSRA